MRLAARDGLFLALWLGALPAGAQFLPDADSRVSVEVPEGVPLTVTAADFGASEFEARGGALVIELAGWVRFRHEGGNAVRAVTLAVRAHEQRLGGRAAVSVPSLHAPRGEQFDVHFNLRMLRPLPAPPGPVVRIVADAVLLDTLASAGPDRLDSVRKMKAREMEARRDREYFLSRWQAGGRDQLASAMQASLRRQASRPRLDIQLSGTGPATVVAPDRSREVQFAFLQDTDAPLILERGSAIVSGTVSDTPRILLRNRSAVGISRFELGWLVVDSAGTAYSLGSAPVGKAAAVAPGERLETGGGGRFEIRFGPDSSENPIAGMRAYVRSAHLEDGNVWIPSRMQLEDLRLLGTIPVSAEEQRLSQLYREWGPDAVVDELRKLQGGADRGSVP